MGESPARSTRLAAAELQTNVAKNSGARLPIKAVAEGGTLFIRPERVVDVRCPVAEACIIASRSMFTN